MYIENLAAQQFRNLHNLRLQPESSVIVLRGKNGQGKTNILEALYLCATGRSFRNATSKQMLQHGSDTGFVSAHWVRQGVRHKVTAHLTAKTRHLKVDDRGLRQTTDLLELMNMVAFFPDDLRIAKGSPEDRRRFLDRAVANSQPRFIQAALAYHRALKARNAILKASEQPDRMLIEVYDEQLVLHGSMMHACREAYLSGLTPTARYYFAAMLPERPELTLKLQSGVPGHDDDYPQAFADALVRSYPRDRARKMTSVGPHRADLAMFMSDEDARVYASQGQQRTLILSLKLAEVRNLRDALGAPPILILDDVSSELDAERTGLLFEVVRSIQCQVWVTTTGSVPLPIPADATTLDIVDGTLKSAPDTPRQVPETCFPTA